MLIFQGVMPLLIQSSNPPSAVAFLKTYAAMKHFFVSNSYLKASAALEFDL